MNKIIFAMTVLAIAMTASVTMGADMIAGNPSDGVNVIGEVTVSNDGSNIIVTYTITDDDYHILTSHLAIWEKGVDKGPKVTGGGPPPGQFPWSTPDGGSTDKIVTYTIPLSGNFPGSGKKAGDAYDWESGDDLYVAAHAVVGKGIGDCSELALPSDVLMRVIYADPLIPELSYFEEVTIPFPCPGDIPDPTTIDGIYHGWCLDPDTGISNDARYLGYPYSSLLPLPTSLTDLWETPDNLPMVIWLLNNTDLIGTASSCSPDPVWGGVNFTYGDFQNAMWGLLEDGDIFAPGDLGTYVLGEFDVCRTLELMDLAMAHSDFVPGCGDYIGVILDTYYVGPCPDLAATPSQRQPVLIPLLCECDYSSMTAWAGIEGSDGPPESPPGEVDDDGYTFEFKGSDWAMYFPYTVQ